MSLAIAIIAAIIITLLLISSVLLYRNGAWRDRLAAYNRLLLESTGEGIYGIDLQGNCTFLNRTGAKMLGIQPEDVRGKNMHQLVHHSHADGTPYPAVQCPINRVLRNGEGSRVEDEVFWRADGTPFPVAYTSFPLMQDGEVKGAAITFTDITDQSRSRRQLAVEHAVSTVLAGSTSFGEAAPRLLQDIGEALSWPFGATWRLDRRGPMLRCTATWTAAGAADREFAAATRQLTLKGGEGLAGRVWAERRAIWSTDLSNEAAFPRARLAQKEGFRGAIAFPVRRGHEVVGVLEFFTRRQETPDPDLIRAVEGLGYQLGQFIERERFEDDLRQSEALKGAVLQAALDCIVTMDHEGKIVEWNAAAEKTFGKVARKCWVICWPPKSFRPSIASGISRVSSITWKPATDPCSTAGWSWKPCALTARFSRSSWLSHASQATDRRGSRASSATSPSASRSRNGCASVKNNFARSPIRSRSSRG